MTYVLSLSDTETAALRRWCIETALERAKTMNGDVEYVFAVAQDLWDWVTEIEPLEDKTLTSKASESK